MKRSGQTLKRCSRTSSRNDYTCSVTLRFIRLFRTERKNFPEDNRMDVIRIIESIGISGFLDILFMSVVIYSLLVWLKQTKAAFVAMGMFIFGVGYLMARQLDLSLTIIVFQGFFAIIVIAVVIIFQEEIKHFLEQLASRNLITKFRLRKVFGVPRKETELLVNVARNFSRDKIGA